ncbi:DnaB-like helicase C-terminal domain-containing protein [Candidatus Vidania fulgoroideorum]
MNFKIKFLIKIIILKIIKKKKLFKKIFKALFKKTNNFKNIDKILKLFYLYYKNNKNFEIKIFNRLIKNKNFKFNLIKNLNLRIKIKTKKLIKLFITKYKKIKLIKNLLKIIKEIRNKNKKISSIFRKIQIIFYRIFKKNNKKNISIKKSLNNLKKKIKNKKKKITIYLKTGFKKLDSIIEGINKGELIIIAGRPSSGKTSFSLNIFENIYFRYKKPVLFCSLEMPKEQILIKIISSISGVETKKIKKKDYNKIEKKKILRSINIIKKSKIYISECGNYNFSFIKKNIKELILKHKKISLIVIDYLQLIQIKKNKENRNNEISKISMYFKRISIIYKVPIILISQLNRSLESRLDKRPLMSDLKDSGSIEQDSDIIIFINKNYYNNKKEIDFYVSKNRNGETGFFKLFFKGKNTKFYE